MEQFKLSLEQANLAFDILELMVKHFPDNPELTITPLKLILQSTTETVEGAQ